MPSNAIEIRSPLVSRMSSSRPGGNGLIWWARSSSSSVVSPMADTTTTTSSPALRAVTIRSATRLMRSASATDEPPYFCTIRATARYPLSTPRVGGLPSVAPVTARRERRSHDPAVRAVTMAYVRAWLTGLAVPLGIGLGAALLVACGGPPADPSPTQGTTANPTDRDALAGLAAAAKDRRYIATDTLSVAKASDRTVTVAFGAENTWMVAIPGGALGGLADIAIYSGPGGLFQCAIGPASGTAGARPD